MCKILEQSTIIHGDIAFQRIWGYRKCCHECSLGVYLVIHNYLYAPSDSLPLYGPVSNFKAIGQLAMDILHFKDLGDTENVATNAVVLVLGECQISILTNFRGVYTLI